MVLVHLRLALLEDDERRHHHQRERDHRRQDAGALRTTGAVARSRFRAQIGKTLSRITINDSDCYRFLALTCKSRAHQAFRHRDAVPFWHCALLEKQRILLGQLGYKEIYRKINHIQ